LYPAREHKQVFAYIDYSALWTTYCLTSNSMSSLSDHTERLFRLAKSINSTAAATVSAPNSGPFTNAVLHAPIEHLIRDADPSELGLFTLQTRPGEHKEEVSRVAFGGATPLRKNLKRKEEGKRKEVEIEPEIYAQAALKYIDRLRVSTFLSFVFLRLISGFFL
jgi:hypothetical protein